MIQFQHILCPTDLSDASRPALRYAAAIAAWYDAQLTVLHVVPTFDAIQIPPGALGETVQLVYPATHAEVVAMLQQQAEATGATAVNPALEAKAGDATDLIVGRALTLQADLVVMGTHGRSGFNRLLYGSIAEQVLHRASCPVLAVPPHAPATADVTFKRVVCALDFSPASLQAVGFALDLARQANGALTVLHTVEWLPEEEPRVHTHFNVPEYRQHLIDDARARIMELIGDESQTWCAIEPVVTAGRAYREILRVAKERGADLIVMGTQGRGGIGLALAGSATQQVVRGAACPVLTVRGAP
ncbi:MAG TPA: universal stress protein [Vicinamibacterales bacterium]|jgi:nucleotide-binding universal stress UspA family protein|nr:universal stress protein [Vicinamibacterales bacterium]